MRVRLLHALFRSESAHRAVGRSGRRVAVVVTLALALGVVAPAGMLPDDRADTSVSWLWSWLSARPSWALPDPVTPRQARGGPTLGEHQVGAEATRAEGGAGRKPALVPGALPAERGQTGKGTEPWTTPKAKVGFDKKSSKPIMSSATRNTQLYKNSDGSVSRKVSPVPLNYQDSAGVWREIDTKLVRGADGRLLSTANSVKVSFDGRPSKSAGGAVPAEDAGVPAPDASAPYELVELTLPGGHVFAYGLQGAARVDPTVNGNIATYRSILPKTDLELVSVPGGAKETLILASREAQSEWVFPLRMRGITLHKIADGSMEMRDAAGKTVATIPFGSMQDSKMQPDGELTTSGDVTYELVKTAEGGDALKMTASRAWLDDPARVYPVRVDPSSGIFDKADVYVDESSTTGAADQNGTSLGVGMYVTDRRRSFIAFPFNQAVGNDTNLIGKQFTAAQISLFHTWSDDCTTHLPVYVHRVLGSWTEAGLQTASWPGPQVSPNPIGEITIPTNYPACNNSGADRSIGAWYDVPLGVDTFNAWSKGEANYGLALLASETDRRGWKRFTSRDYTQAALYPTLFLTYEDNAKPQIDAQNPQTGYATPTLTPVLSVSSRDPDAWPQAMTHTFQVFDKDAVKIADSGAIAASTWQVPAGVLKWGESYAWTAIANDGNETSNSQTVNVLTTPVPQPPITAGLSQNADKGFAPSVGNYTTTAVDVQIASVGPSLSVQRSYNSLDPRVASAFGAGWATLYDMVATPRRDPVTDAVRNVVVTYPTGQDVAFGRYPDGTYAPPSGRFATFRELGATGYELVDKDGTKYVFTQAGTLAGQFRLSSVADAQGRTLTLQYTSGKVSSATAASGRKLYFTWSTPAGATAPHVTEVRADQLTAGQPTSAPTWTYGYSADALTSVCTTATECSRYEYTDRSLYPSAVRNLGPRTYWRLDDTGSVLANSALDNVTPGSGYRSNVTTGLPGPLGGSSSTALGFNGTTSYVSYDYWGEPAYSVSAYQTISMWVKPGAATGVLYGQSSKSHYDGTASAGYSPTLYLGADGRVMGQLPIQAAPGLLGSLTIAEAGRCLDVAAGEPTLGAQAQISDCVAGRPTQQWTLDSQNRLQVTKNGVTRCMEAVGVYSPYINNPVSLGNCGSATSQQWRVGGDGLILSVSASACLRPQDYGTANLTPIVLRPCPTRGEYSWDSSFTASRQAPMESTTSLTDGQWHHVVLAAAGTKQTLYVDGVQQDELVGLVQPVKAVTTYVGNGFLGGGWPNQPNTPADGSSHAVIDGFEGALSDVAFFDQGLTDDAVAELYQAKRTAQLLTEVKRPSGGVSAHVTYDPRDSVVTEVTDAHGGTWKIGRPTTSGGSNAYVGAVAAGAPYDYFRMKENGVTLAVNEINGGTATYSEVTLGTPATLFPDTTVASFNGTSSYLQLPARDVVTTGPNSVSLWFRMPAGSGTGGVLYSYQSHPVTDAASTNFNPALYVGTDGRLRGEFWTGGISPMVSGGVVNDGRWHHVALTAATGTQSMYVDGVKVATKTGTIAANGTAYAYLGAGRWQSWPGGLGNIGYFNGEIAEFAFYRSQLTDGQVTAQFQARSELPETNMIVRHGNGTGGLLGTTDVVEAAGCATASNAFPTKDYNQDGYPDFVCRNGEKLMVHDPWEWKQIRSARTTWTGCEDLFSPGDFNGDGYNDILCRKSADGGLYLSQGFGTAMTTLGDLSLIQAGWSARELFSPGDFSGDGKPDVLYRQLSDNGLYMLKGNGTGGFTGTAVLLASGWAGRSPLQSRGDFDGDGKPDVFFRQNSDRTVHYLRGNGTGGFVSTTPVALGLTATSRDFMFVTGDLNGDGKPDLVERQSAFHGLHEYYNNPGYRVKKVTVTDPGDKPITYVYDLGAGNRQLEQVDATGGLTRFGYDTAGFLRSTVDPNGDTTVEEHDVRGNVIAKTTCQDRSENKCSTVYSTYYPDATTKTLTPSPLNDVLLTSRDGRSSGPTDNTYLTTYTYDAKGNRTRVTDPLGRVTETFYTDGTTTPAEGGGFAPAGLPWRTVSPGGSAEEIVYRQNGDVAATIDAVGLRTNMTHDALGRVLTKTVVVSTTPSVQYLTRYEYDQLGRVTKQTDPAVLNRVSGATHTAVTTTVYDADGHVVSQSVADDGGGDATRTSTNGYNTLGQLVSMTDPRGKSRTITYDAYGNKITETDPSGTTQAYTYNAAGQLLTTTLKGWTGDPNAPSAPADLLTESRAYDLAGRLAAVTDAEGFKTEYKYTDNGLTVSTVRRNPQTGATFTVEANTYDAAGNLLSKTTNNGFTTLAYTVDAAGRTTKQTLDPTGINRTTTMVYGPDDTVLSTIVADATGSQITDATYDPMGRMTSQTVRHAGTGEPNGWWRLNETTGSVATDATIAQRHATAGAGLTWADGAAKFSGATSSALKTAAPVLNTQQSFSVSAWVYLTSLDTYSTAVAQEATVGSGFFLQYNWYWDRWVFARSNTDTTNPVAKEAVSSALPPWQEWSHLVATWDAGTGHMKLFVNGVLDGSATSTSSFASSGGLTIGRSKFNGAAADPWQGSVDNVQTYQRAISAADAAALYAQGRNGGALGVGSTTSWNLDKRGLPTTKTDPNGNVTSYSYDEAGRLAQTVSPQVSTETGGGAPVNAVATAAIGYNTFGEEVEAQDSRGNVKLTQRDAAGNATHTIAPAYTPPGSSTPIVPDSEQVFDDAGQVVESIDALGRRTVVTYDQLGRVASTRAPNDGVTRYTYDLLGNQRSVTSPTGARSETTYDMLGRKVTATEVDGASSYVTAYGYHANSGMLATVTPPGRAATSYEYNASGTTKKVTDGNGKITSYLYDFADRVTQTTLPDNSRQTMTYNALGKPTRQQQLSPTGTVLTTTSATYDNNGNLKSSTDAMGWTTTLSYNSTNQLTEAVQPISATDSITVSLGYDVAGSQTRFTDGRGNKFVNTYNSWGLLESQIEPGGRAFTQSYDAAGQVTRQSAPGGVAVDNTYTALGMLETQVGTGADATTDAREYGYDVAGRMTSVEEGSRQTTFGYNGRNLLASISGAPGSSSFTYEPGGQVATRTDAAGTATYNYDNGGRLATITDPSTGELVTFEYNNLSQPNKITYGASGNRRTLGYDALNRLSSDVLATPTNQTIASILYTFDNNGNELTKTTYGFAGAGSNSYTYDRANRLTSWTAGSSTVNYEYDKSGNRTRIGSRVLTYDGLNQLQSDGQRTYSYTPRGTLAGTTEGTVVTPSTFDAYNQQITQGTQTYAYDGLGRVVSSTGAPAITYSGLGNDVASDGSATYSRGPAGGLVGVKSGASGVFAWTDLHSDVVGQFTSISSAMAGTRTYQPLGGVSAAATMAGKLGYQSGWTDPATSQVNMHARWYNPTSGQFSSRDTATVSAPVSSIRDNRYQYGDGNPLTVTDPTGHWGWSDLTSGVSKLWNKTTSAISTGFNNLVSGARALVDFGKQKFNELKNWVVKKTVETGQKLQQAAADLRQRVADKARHAQAALATAFDNAKNFVEEGKQKLADAYKSAETWVKEHKAEIAGFVVGAVVGVGCGLAVGWTGVGAVACGVLAGAAGSWVTGAMQGKTGWDLVGDIALGGLVGGITGGLGSMFSAGLSKGASALWNGLGGKGALSAAWGAIKGEGANILGGLKGLVTGGIGGLRSAIGSGLNSLKNAGGTLAQGLKNMIKPGCRTHSFDPATRVLLAGGTAKAIGDVEVGDEVLATDPETGQSVARPVVAHHVNLDEDLAEVTVRDQASGETTVVETTQHHPFWNADEERWDDAKDLAPGTRLRDDEGKETQLVVSVKTWSGLQEMHDLTVADIHTYYVVTGDRPILVHNCGSFMGPLDHVALGRNKEGVYETLENFADDIKARHLMDMGDDWRAGVESAIARLARGEGRISFMLEHLRGGARGPKAAVDVALERAKEGLEKGMTFWEIADDPTIRFSNTQAELLMINAAGLMDKVEFYWWGHFDLKWGRAFD